ncbi:DUF4129 domain-containing protein [Halobacteria archaeon AArc-m2/3/4]|uniref:DUF4129 domain-containing protein n=1 Tax=Natronoglomus mannanivorans TaxID=2979990 RepID=A0ABT2QFL4_9EURY|nr:DUF4129 domain-containing protein [Halobacteria archaeon AArc-m2/3/4]
MNRHTLQTGLAGGVGVLALAVAAGAIDSTQSSGSETGDGNPTAASSGVPDAMSRAPEAADIVPSVLFHFVWTIPILSLVTVFVVACLYYLYRDGLAALLSTFRFLVVLFVYTHLVVALIAGPYLVGLIRGSGQGSDGRVSTDGPTFGQDGDSSFGVATSSSGGGHVDLEAVSQFPFEAGVMLVCALGVVIVVFLSRETISNRLGSVVGGDPPVGLHSDDGRQTAVTAATGDPDSYSLSHEAVSNDVYRAWVSVVDAVDDSRRSTETPTETADRAVESGIDERPVRELTDLFEDVRYGGGVPTPDREQYALTLAHRATDDTGGDDE